MAHKHLIQWIDEVTRGLCADARERVAREVSAHFLDALQDAHAKGFDGTSARELAIRDLGNARAARSAYRRVYLTAVEENRIADLLGCSTWHKFKGIVALANLLMMQWMSTWNHHDPYSVTILNGAVTMFLFYLASVLLVTPRLLRARLRTLALTLNFVTQMMCLGMFVLCYRNWPDGFLKLVPLLFVVLIAWSLYDFISLRRKLGADSASPNPGATKS